MPVASLSSKDSHSFPVIKICPHGERLIVVKLVVASTGRVLAVLLKTQKSFDHGMIKVID